MHLEVYNACQDFFKKYLEGKENLAVLDVGSYDVNGSLRPIFEFAGESWYAADNHGHSTSRGLSPKKNYIYHGLDISSGPNVDIVRDGNKPFPIKDGTYDAVVSSSTFEHDPQFWVTFREMVRVTKGGGYIHISTPSAGPYHAYPQDCWRFYPDAYKALSSWCPQAQLIETYIIPQTNNSNFMDNIGNFKVQRTGVQRTGVESMVKYL